eukprot:138129-Amphidinium_carterae.1
MQPVSLSRAAVIGSSDSDGFIHVSIEDTPPVSSKKQDKEIVALERKLASLKAAKQDKTSSSTDSDRGTSKTRKQETEEETGFVDDEIKETESNEELLAFARQLPRPEGVVDRALTQKLSSDMVGKVTTYSLRDGVNPDPPSIRSKGESGGCTFDRIRAKGHSSRDDVDMIPLTPISELHMHREPYEEVPENPFAGVEQHPTFQGGRSLKDKGLEEKDPYMNQVYSAELKKRWTGANADQYRVDVFCKQAAGNQPLAINLMCFRCLGEIENEPKKYCHPKNELKPSTTFRTKVTRLQNSHKHTVKYLQTMGQQKRKILRVDAALLRLMVSEFGGSADFVTSMGLGDTQPRQLCHALQLSIVSDSTIAYEGLALWMSIQGFVQTTIPLSLLCSLLEVGHRSTRTMGSQTGFCVQDLCKDHNVSLSKVLQAIGVIDKATEERCKLHMRWEIKKCADPRMKDFPEFEPICMDDRSSVRHIGQEVHIGYKDSEWPLLP